MLTALFVLRCTVLIICYSPRCCWVLSQALSGATLLRQPVILQLRMQLGDEWRCRLKAATEHVQLSRSRTDGGEEVQQQGGWVNRKTEHGTDARGDDSAERQDELGAVPAARIRGQPAGPPCRGARHSHHRPPLTNSRRRPDPPSAWS